MKHPLLENSLTPGVVILRDRNDTVGRDAFTPSEIKQKFCGRVATQLEMTGKYEFDACHVCADKCSRVISILDGEQF